jgi:vacuolar protein sorting-associated protein 41
MGRNDEALALMLDDLRDVPAAIEFVQSMRDETLWRSLVSRALLSSDLIDALLGHVCRAPLTEIDQLSLVRQLPLGVQIPRLRTSLIALLEQAANQLELTQACMQVAQADHVALLQRSHACRRAGNVCTPRPLPPERGGGGAPVARSSEPERTTKHVVLAAPGPVISTMRALR